MGNKQAGHSTGYAHPSHAPPQGHNNTVADRDQLAQSAEQRLAKKRAKPKEDVKAAHWQRYKDLQASGGPDVPEDDEDEEEDTATRSPAAPQPAAANALAPASAAAARPASVSPRPMSDREQRAAMAEARMAKKGVLPKPKSPTPPVTSGRPTTPSSEAKSPAPAQIDPELASEIDTALVTMVTGFQGSQDLLLESGRMLSNILAKLVETPKDQVDKFRKIKLSNPKVQERIIGVSGALKFLVLIGFEVVALPAADCSLEEYLNFSGNDFSVPTYALASIRNYLQTSES